MPGKKHLAGATAKENRQYEAVKKSYVKRGVPADRAKMLAAKTVNARKGK